MSRVGIIGRSLGPAFIATLAERLEEAGHEFIHIGAPEQIPPLRALDESSFPRRRRGKGERKRNRGSRWS
jgi:hypothetical protein